MDKGNQEKMHATAQYFSKYVGMAIILDDGSNPNSIIGNGTISFVDTGKRQILVTCAHVYEKFSELKKDKKVILGLAGGYGRQPLDITEAIVINKERKYIDLAILELPLSCNLESIDREYFLCNQWPPERAKKGDLAFMVGYPGIHRQSSPRGLEIRSTPIVDFVSGSSQRHFTLADENQEREVVKYKDNLKEFGSLGGISGAAVYISKDGCNPPKSAILAGFAYESNNDGKNAIILAHHADYINDDGKINRSMFI